MQIKFAFLMTFDFILHFVVWFGQIFIKKLNPTRMTKIEKLSLLIATWFGSGLIPPILLKSMAGTYGSLFALPLCWIGIEIGNIWIYLAFWWAIGFIGIYTVPSAETTLRKRTDWRGNERERDQPQIVIDEVLGMLVTCFPLLFVPEPQWYHYAIAFGLFRLFDIVKLWPANLFDKVKDEYGVMYDDFFAGVHSAIVLQAMIWWVIPWVVPLFLNWF